jgi:5-methylcytosine-specific restriction endonuclease McrA
MATASDRYSFACPHCKATLRAKASLQGQTRPCAGCQRPIVLPADNRRTQAKSSDNDTNIDLERSLGVLAANAADVVQKACVLSSADGILLNSLFMYLPEEHDLGDAGLHLSQKLQQAWKICREVRSICAKSSTDSTATWLRIYERMKIYVPEDLPTKTARTVRKRWGIKTRRQVWERFGKRCYYCGLHLVSWRGQFMHLDHMTAIADGGADSESNLVPACADCNLEKGRTRFPELSQEHKSHQT